MYVPKHFQEHDEDRLLAFLQQYSFALLVSSVANRPWATHLPFTIENAEGKVKLYSHMALANEQWKELSNGQQVMVVFSGPHGFVSPKHYDNAQNVPTWDYIAVHAYGNITIQHDREEKMTILNKMVATYDPAFASQFAKLDKGYLEGNLSGIVAITIAVTDIQGQFKLSQNKNVHERERIINDFETKHDGAAADLAEQMKNYLFS